MYLFAAAALIAADQLTKVMVAGAFAPGESVSLVPGFHLTYVQNTGAAFGILQQRTPHLSALSALVALGLLTYLLFNARALPRVHLWALVLIFSGAVGNMIDRFRLGYVIDFIHFEVPDFSFYIFNIADVCVVLGGTLLIGLSVIQSWAERRQKKDVSVPQHTPATERGQS